MIILKGLLCIIWLLIIPTILGKLLIKKEESEILYSWVLGNILQMAIFFVIAIPLILLKESFNLLVYIYGIAIISLVIISLIISLIIFILRHKKNKLELKIKWPKITIFQILAIILIILQLFIKFKYTNINNDDASFVTLSTAMIETDKMYLHNENGEEENKIIPRRALAPISAYYSTISKLLDIHVTIVTHTIMPIIFIALAYSVYYYFGKKVFKEKDSVFIFLIILSILNLFAFDYKGANRYLLLYTWFGRAVLGGIMLPLIWKISFDAMDKEKNKVIDWIILFITVLASCLGSQIAVPLVSISIMSITMVKAIRDKKISYIFKSLLCIIPCIVIGIIYLIIK